MLVESIREMARAIEKDTLRKVARVLCGKATMDAVWTDARAVPFVIEKSKHANGMRVVRVAGLEIRERPWELACDVRFEVEA
jgi:hypothetical protein